MSRRPDPSPSKAALYQRKWRAKNPVPPKIPKLKSVLGTKIMYREAQKERYRWSAVLKSQRDLIFKDDRGIPKTYSYVDALYRRDNKPAKTRTPQAEYQRRYRERRKAELPESVALPRILAALPEELHQTLHNLLATIRRSPPPKPQPEKPALSAAPTTVEQRHQAVLDAGTDLVFDGETYYHEDALWWEKNK